jgi:hypothetical protein
MTFPSSTASSVRCNVSASDSVTEGEARASTPFPKWDIRVLYDGTLAELLGVVVQLQASTLKGIGVDRGDNELHVGVNLNFLCFRPTGDCPLCLKEINFLKTRNEKYSTIDFVDLSAETYSPAANQNISFERGMETIHGILPNGAIITGVTVFRRLYEVSRSSLSAWLAHYYFNGHMNSPKEAIGR